MLFSQEEVNQDLRSSHLEKDMATSNMLAVERNRTALALNTVPPLVHPLVHPLGLSGLSGVPVYPYL